jgi:hypothetical protein
VKKNLTKNSHLDEKSVPELAWADDDRRRKLILFPMLQNFLGEEFMLERNKLERLVLTNKYSLELILSWTNQ